MSLDLSCALVSSSTEEGVYIENHEDLFQLLESTVFVSAFPSSDSSFFLSSRMVSASCLREPETANFIRVSS